MIKSIPSLGHHNYFSDRNLLKRLAFVKYCRPRVNLNREISRRLGIGRGGREKKIFDVGCGNGQTLIQIRQSGFAGELFGIDIAAGILKIAKKSNSDVQAGIHFAEGDAENLKFSNNTFDYLILKHVLQNVYRPLRALQECARVLKPGGKIAIAVNGRKTRLIFRKMRPRIAKILHLKSFPDSDKHFNLENLSPLARKVFENVKVARFISKVRLRKTQPYLDYIDSTRSFWEKSAAADDAEWQKALDFSREYLEKILKQKGEIKDYVTIGVIIARK